MTQAVFHSYGVRAALQVGARLLCSWLCVFTCGPGAAPKQAKPQFCGPPVAGDVSRTRLVPEPPLCQPPCGVPAIFLRIAQKLTSPCPLVGLCLSLSSLLGANALPFPSGLCPLPSPVEPGKVHKVGSRIAWWLSVLGNGL